RGEGHGHGGERYLDELTGADAREVPRPEGVSDPGPESRLVREAEARVVLEARPLEVTEIAVGIETQEVVPLAADGTRDLFEPALLLREPLGIVGRGVATVQADLGSAGKRLDEPRPQSLVRLRRRAVELVRVAGHQEEGRRRSAAA